MNSFKRALIAFLSVVLFFLYTIPAYSQEPDAPQNNPVIRPSSSGILSVKGTDIVDENGSTVTLKGVSLHGITWFPDFVNESLFDQVSREWEANLIRLPVYSEEYVKNRDESLALAQKGIEAAIAADMYVLVDWHILEDNDPNIHIEEAKEFFSTICSQYADKPNLIYEICNEPNGETTWSDVRNYAYEMIPLIRSYNPDSLIVVGTPNYCRDLLDAGRNSLKYDNIMYSLHFYASTHKDDLRRELVAAHNQGIPVFVTECGLSEASGTGVVDYDSAAAWFSLLEDDNISYAIWSLSNKNETSALLVHNYNPATPITDDDLTGTGTWVYQLLKGQDPRSIPIPPEGLGLSKIPAWILNPLETENIEVAKAWPKMALCVLIFELLALGILGACVAVGKTHFHTYNEIYSMDKNNTERSSLKKLLLWIVILATIFVTLLYLSWRILYSVPVRSGPLAITGNILLLIVEILGFVESLVLYNNLAGMKEYPLPVIEEEDFPDVDIFIATYNEPADLLRKTINGCRHISYPDKKKVHIWLCDDNRRPEMRKLAEDMHIGYFDRPDNKGAKAGNLNHALNLTNSPYIVTLDADMIPRSNFLLSTIPYFVDARKHSMDLPNDKKVRLGLLQTPQCFYTPDVFQHALYAEKSAPNEQDFFYRTIEVAKTTSNSVIYGGSNTIISREALDAIGGFYTESITEDFATGMLIEAAGFVSLALPEPLASGMTPHTYKEHIQQRKRWGRGVISTAKQLHMFRRPGLSFAQKLSYWSSVIYWYSPIKNMIYLVSPLLFATFAIPVFKCGWLDLMIYWFPMFILQDVCLRVFSRNAVSLKWSGIYETSVMPHLLIPVIKETFGITTSVFEVTDKSKKKSLMKRDKRSMYPFIVLLILCVIGIIRSIYVFTVIKAMGIIVLLFWLIRNTYYLIMSIFLVDGRDSDNDSVTVIDAEMITLKKPGSDQFLYEGITTYMTEHSLKVFLDDDSGLKIGDYVDLTILSENRNVEMKCVITGRTDSRVGDSLVFSLEVIDPGDDYDEYLQILYDRIPTLPQSLQHDYGIIYHMLRNIAFRILR